MAILENIVRISESHKIPVIFCGDFNIIPSSNIYRAITTGLFIDNFEKSDQLIEPLLAIPSDYTKYPLTSTYKYIFKQEPRYTNYTPQFKNTLDYIFVNDKCKVIGQLKEVNLDKITRIPNSEYPSDHLMQMCLIRLN